MGKTAEDEIQKYIQTESQDGQNHMATTARIITQLIAEIQNKYYNCQNKAFP